MILVWFETKFGIRVACLHVLFATTRHVCAADFNLMIPLFAHTAVQTCAAAAAAAAAALPLVAAKRS